MAHPVSPEEHVVSREQALEIAARAAEMLQTRFGATRVIVFGSARGDTPWHKGSDLDLAVEGVHGETYWQARRAIRQLVPCSLEFDLVPLEKAHPNLRARILREVVVSDDPIRKLENLIRDELVNLAEIVSRLSEITRRVSETPSLDDLDLMAFKLQQFYSGVENIFERIAVQFDDGVPKSERWHADLLFQMTQSRPNHRPAVIDGELWKRLDDLLDFRHLVIHAYSITFDPERVLRKAKLAPETLDMLRAQLDRFFRALESERGKA